MIILKKKYVIGTRKSELAIKQCNIVKSKLMKKYPDYEFVVKKIVTSGDREKDKKYSEVNIEGFFVREIEYALLEGEIDLAVHSFKDLPTKLPSELEIAAIVDRANRLDVLAGADKKLADLPLKARLGTGSLRRKSQLLAYRPDLEIVPVRGNVDTRLNKIKEKKLDGLILAAAGLLRLGFKDHITEFIKPEICLPAARQGAIAVEIRNRDQELKKMLQKLEDGNTVLEVWAEHSFLEAMNAGCHAPIAAQALIDKSEMILKAVVGKPDGTDMISLEKNIKDLNLKSVKRAGRKLAAEMLTKGGAEIIEDVKIDDNKTKKDKDTGKVFLTGAGPGDPLLLTLKAKKVLSEADVILFDRLANNRLLEHALDDAEKIYVGKKANEHTLKQKEIEKLMIEKAKAGKKVCRLKGGDPFIYGRGGEEALKLEEAGIEFEVIPGISSSMAAPTYAGIPLTQRHIASSFAVITGHEASDKKESSIDIEKLATTVDTLVILMGVGNLPEITKRIISAGRRPETPVALVRWGTKSKQKTVVGTISNITNKVKQKGLKPPAVIIIGEVVNLREKLGWFEKKRLFGKKILVTRPPAQSDNFIKMIEEKAGSVAKNPVIKIRGARNNSALKRSLKNLEQYSHIIFTSVNGVKYFMAELERLGKDSRSLSGIKIVTIGPKTADKLRENGIKADFIPDDYSTEGILNYLKELEENGQIDFKDTSFLLPRSNIAPKYLQNALHEMGADVDNITAYRTERLPIEPNILENIIKDELNLLTFTSSSTVDYFIKGINELLENNKFEKFTTNDILGKVKSIPVACIGPVTAETAKKQGLNVVTVAEKYTIKGLMEAIISYFD